MFPADNVISSSFGGAAGEALQSIRTLLTATADTVDDEDVFRCLQRLKNRRMETKILMSESFTLYDQVYY